jgi:predicted DNA-binding transcriptional regulator AlpA
MASGLAPYPVKLGKRSVAWIEGDLEGWMLELQNRREG